MTDTTRQHDGSVDLEVMRAELLGELEATKSEYDENENAILTHQRTLERLIKEVREAVDIQALTIAEEEAQRIIGWVKQIPNTPDEM